jgi:hypothetical protein
MLQDCSGARNWPKLPSCFNRQNIAETHFQTMEFNKPKLGSLMMYVHLERGAGLVHWTSEQSRRNWPKIASYISIQFGISDKITEYNDIPC